MHFDSKEQLDRYLSTLKQLGFGAQGTTYYDPKFKVVLKILEGAFEEDEEYQVEYSESEVLKFEGIQSDTYIFPLKPIYLGDKVIGYISKKAPGKLLTDIDPLRVDYDTFTRSAIKGFNDTIDISKSGVMTYDMVYNMMYQCGKISVIDTDDYAKSRLPEELLIRKNKIVYNTGISRFLIDCYFDEILDENMRLRMMYIDRDFDLETFLIEFKAFLEERSQREIKKLGDARELLNKGVWTPTYVRKKTNMSLLH